MSSLYPVKLCGLQKNIRWSRYSDHRSACGAIFQFCGFGLFGSDKPTLKILNICRWPTIPTNEWRESQRLRTTSSDRDLPRRKSSCPCTLQFPLSSEHSTVCRVHTITKEDTFTTLQVVLLFGSTEQGPCLLRVN